MVGYAEEGGIRVALAVGIGDNVQVVCVVGVGVGDAEVGGDVVVGSDWDVLNAASRTRTWTCSPRHMPDRCQRRKTRHSFGGMSGAS